MTVLAQCDENAVVARTLTEVDAIARELGAYGVVFQVWPSEAVLAAEANQEAVLAAYRSQIEALNERYGFHSVDVVSLRPDHPHKAELRRKFLAEHTHADFELRFFVDGRGLFYLHLGREVWMLLCEKGDLITVPAGTPHWFDMGEQPDFRCIRFFTAENGWVGEFTGSGIAARFPSFDAFVTQHL